MGKRATPEVEPELELGDIDAAMAAATPVEPDKAGASLDAYDPPEETAIVAASKNGVAPGTIDVAWRSVKVELAEAWGVQEAHVKQILLKRIVAGNNQQVNDLHIAQACILARKYDLNPLLNQVYFFLSKDGVNVVPVVGVDGWAYIVAKSGKLNGLSFEYSQPGDNDPWCRCTMWLKGCEHPVVHTEYLKECKRNTQPWNNCERRMLRNRTYCQTARIALGITGIFEEDEARDAAGMNNTADAQAKAAELTARLNGAHQ